MGLRKIHQGRPRTIQKVYIAVVIRIFITVYSYIQRIEMCAYGGEDFLQQSIKGTHGVCGQDGLRSVTKYRIMPFIASPYLVITDRHVIERILKTPGNINRMDVRADRIMFGNTLVSSNGDDWKQRRRIMAKSFHMDMLATYHDGINNQCQEMVACFTRQLDSHDSINVMSQFHLNLE